MMKQPVRTNQEFSTENKIKIIAAIVYLGTLLFILGFLLGFLVGGRQFSFSLPALQAQVTPTTLALVAPTDCDASILVLGTNTFQIRPLTREADGSLAVPADTFGIAYRIKGTGAASVFVLSPTPQNISVLSTIQVGSTAQITGGNCLPSTYILSAAQPGSLASSAFAEQSAEQITVFFPTESSGVGFLFKGKPAPGAVLLLNPSTPVIETTLPPSLASTIPTNTIPASTISPVVENTTVPAILPSATSIPSATAVNISPTSPPTSVVINPPPAEILVEVGPLTTSRSASGSSIIIEAPIHNVGTTPYSLSESDLTLAQRDDTPLALISSTLPLPQQIQPGETKTFQFEFPIPNSSTAILTIYAVEYEIEGY